MIDDEEDKPKQVAKPKLGEMSIEALGEYIDELKAEIARAEEAIEAKQGIRGEADSLFKR
ncbi:MAG: DUF1192 domain-containing protein [Alphaproteobacteria bacterium]